MQTESTSKDKSLLDGLRRLTQHSPVMGLPRLIMTQHLHSSLTASRKRLRDSHKHLHNLMGEDVGEDDDAGINVQGDTINYHLQGGSWTKPLAGLLLAGALGAAAPLAYWWWNNKPSVTPATLPDYQLRLEVTDRP